MRYGPTPENMELITKKAKEKQNGVYRFRGVVYRVRENRVTHIAHDGQILERYGHFNVQIGTYERYQDEAAKIMRAL